MIFCMKFGYSSTLAAERGGIVAQKFLKIISFLLINPFCSNPKMLMPKYVPPNFRRHCIPTFA